jgi:hypothetical protein
MKSQDLAIGRLALRHTPDLGTGTQIANTETLIGCRMFLNGIKTSIIFAHKIINTAERCFFADKN